MASIYDEFYFIEVALRKPADILTHHHPKQLLALIFKFIKIT